MEVSTSGVQFIHRTISTCDEAHQNPSELCQCNDYGFASKAKPWNWDRVTDTQLVISLRTLGILMWFWMSLLTYKNLFAIQQSSGHKLIYATRGSILVYTSSQAEDFTAVSMDLQLSVPYYHYYLIPLTKLAWWAFMSSNKTNHTVQRKSKLEKDYIAPSLSIVPSSLQYTFISVVSFYAQNNSKIIPPLHILKSIKDT